MTMRIGFTGLTASPQARNDSSRRAVMARILVLYGTTTGHTAKIARSIGDTLRQQGVSVDVIEGNAEWPAAEDYAAVVVAASVRGGNYQRPVRRWVRANAAALNARPTAFVSVCLGVLQHEPAVQEEVAAISTRFLTAAGWRPTVTKTVAGALLYTQYNPLLRWVMKRITRKAGGDTDTNRDYEYTDWSDLRTFAEDFGRRVPGGASEGDASSSRTRVA
jgi:menaquinone-dependent protoporphyrinogen oxidase